LYHPCFLLLSSIVGLADQVLNRWVRSRQPRFPSAFPAGAADGRFKGGFYDTQLSKRYGKNDRC
jgi:hypothetical protein